MTNDRLSFARSLRLTGWFIATCFAALVLVTNINNSYLDTSSAIYTVVPGEADMNADIASGSCWTEGEGHAYPTKVWVRTATGFELKGQHAVDTAIAHIGSNIRPIDFRAFCA